MFGNTDSGSSTQPRRRRVAVRGMEVLLLAVLIADPSPTMAQGPGEPRPGPTSAPSLQGPTPPDLAESEAPNLGTVGLGAAADPGDCWVTTPVSREMCDVVRESIFGAASKDDWHELSLGSYFSEGWDEPYVRAPEGTNDAPKEPWLLAPTGVFARAMTVDFFYTNGMTNHAGLLLDGTEWSPVKPNAIGSEYNAVYNLFLPMNRRLEFQVIVPFIAANGRDQGGGGWVGNFGDLTIGSRFLLADRRNFSMVGVLTSRTPTGRSINGNDVSFVSPALEAWWNLAPKWVVRGETGINILTSNRSATDVYFNKLSVGRYLTGKDAAIFKQLVVFGTVTALSDVRGSKDYISDIYLTPGIRFGLGREETWYVQAAVQVPISGPQPYAFQPVFSLVRTY